MCLFALFFRVVEDAAVVVGANREEVYRRGGDPPRLVDDGRVMVAGVDPVGGGTWLGVNTHGVVVAVTNRARSGVPPQPRSRGLLVRDLLACPTAAATAAQAARELEGDRYAGCNIVCLDRDRALVVMAGDWLRVRPLLPGIHVLANRDINDSMDLRVNHSRAWLSHREYGCARHCIAALQELCVQTGSEGPPICLHGSDRGTVSSSILALRQPLARSTFLHAQGAPDQTPYVDLSYLLRDLIAPDAPEGKSPS